MNKMKFLVLLCLIAVAAVNAPAQGKQTQSNKNKYQAIEITRFDVKAGTDLPPDYLNELMKDVANQMYDTNKFKQVARPGEALANPNEPAVRLVGTVTEFKKGSQMKRYMIGFGAGKTKIVVHIKFVDVATGAVVLERNVDGKVVIGLFGGKSEGATNGVAKEIAKVVKKEFF
jgi:hypothetical protein